MNNEITRKQFFNTWAKTGKDPDGNNIEIFLSGGRDNSYLNWIKTKQINVKNFNNPDTLNASDITKYKWVSEKDGCFKCKSLDGKVFDFMPNVEEVTHPHCKCKVVEISEYEADMLKKQNKENLNQMEEVVASLSGNAKTLNETDGKFYDKYGNQVKTGQCAQYVADALLQGGVNLKQHQDIKNNKDYFKAYRYGEYLEKEGFLELKSGGSGKNPKNYEPQKGDVAIFQPLYEGHEGHMQMYNGEYWVSDFKQNTTGGIARSKDTNLGDGFFANQSYKDKGAYSIYRHPKWVEW